MSTAQRYADAESASRTGFWGNMLLALLKGAAGSMTGSKALLADAFRTGAEAARDAAAWAGLRASRSNRSVVPGGTARKERDKGELATPILMSVILLIVGLEIAISAIRDIADGVESAPHWSALVAIAAGLAAQRLLLPPKDRQMGLYCSVASLVGAAVAIAGGWLELPALYYFDPAAALVIACIVTASGYRIATSMALKSDRNSAEEESSEELMQLVQRIEGVVTVQAIRAKEHGHYVIAEMTICVNPRITVAEGQEIGKRVKQLVMKRFAHVTDVIVAVEPYDAGYPYKSNHDPNQEHMPTLLQ